MEIFLFERGKSITASESHIRRTFKNYATFLGNDEIFGMICCSLAKFVTEKLLKKVFLVESSTGFGEHS
jgi:hypothetical protein